MIAIYFVVQTEEWFFQTILRSWETNIVFTLMLFSVNSCHSIRFLSLQISFVSMGSLIRNIFNAHTHHSTQLSVNFEYDDSALYILIFCTLYSVQTEPLFVDLLQGQCHEIFSSGFFHESVSPQPQSMSLGPIQIFSKIRGDIRKSRCTAGINDTGGKFATGINDAVGKFCHQFR